MAAWVAESRALWRDLTGGSPEFTFLAFQGLNQLVFGSRGYHASRVIHQRVEPGSGRLGAVGSTAVAALRGGAHRSACARDVLGLGTCTNECGCMRTASASQDWGNEAKGRCSKLAMVEQRQWNAGDGVPASGAAFRP